MNKLECGDMKKMSWVGVGLGRQREEDGTLHR